MNSPFDTSVLWNIQQHALSSYPNSSHGFIAGNVYHRLETGQTIASGHDVQALVHSKPDGEAWPNEDDMRRQMEACVPFGIVSTNGTDVSTPVFWGDGLPITDLIGRSFVHGVWDCYSLVRDAYRLGSRGMSAQGMSDWELPPVMLSEFPRSDNWWSSDQDLYADNFKEQGFKIIDMEEARPGDAFISKIRSDKLNHAGVLVADNTILHHLPGRMSRRESAGMWARFAEFWIRYTG